MADGLTEQQRGEHVQLFFDLQVSISGTVKTLNEVFFALTKPEALAILQNNEVKGQIAELVRTSSVLKLDSGCFEPHALYIPRAVCSHVLIDPKIFGNALVSDVFVFKGVDRDHLLQLAGSNLTRSSTSQQSRITCRYIYLVDDEHWEDLVLASKVPIHLISMQNKNYVLEQSTEVQSIRRSTGSPIEEPGKKEAYITEDKLVSKLLSFQKNQGVLVCDIPGMGKSWLMRSIARRCQLSSNETVVFFVDLPEFAQHLVATNEQIEFSHTLNFILKFACSTPLAVLLLSHHMLKNQRKIIFILDGFDEIKDTAVETTTLFLTELMRDEKVCLVVSSRPHMRAHLEKRLNLLSYDILPLERHEQVTAIVGWWLERISGGNSEKLIEFAEQCIDSFEIIKANQKGEILGVPHQCYLLAVVNETYARQVSSPTRKNTFILVDHRKVQSIQDLYKRSIEELIRRRLPEANSTLSEDNLFDTFMKYHTQKAFELLFPEIAAAYSVSSKADVSFEQLITKIGLLVPNENAKLVFMHRSFAEFLVGTFFAEFWINIESHDDKAVEKLGTLFFENVLKTTFKGLEIYTSVKTLLDKEFGYKQTGALTGRTSWFNNDAVMWFFDAMYSERRDQLKIEKIRSQHRWYKKTLRRYASELLFCCIIKDLSSVMSLIVFVANFFFVESERPSLLYLPGISLSRKHHDIYFLCFCADRGSPETASELINLIGGSKYLLKLSKNYPEWMRTPLQIAIMRNDPDMVAIFDKSFKNDLNQLLGDILLNQPAMDTDVSKKALIMEQIFRGHDNFISHLSQYSFLQDSKLLMLGQIAFQCKLCLHSINFKTKVRLLRACLSSLSDEDMIIQLLLIFSKEKKKYFTRMENFLTPSGSVAAFTAENVLRELDLDDARDTFNEECDFYYCFTNMQNVETLKVFIGMCPNFGVCTGYKLNYLHFAVINVNIEWMRFLIESGYQINERDARGNTPLLHIRDQKPVEVTKLLLDNKADVNAVNDNNENVAHMLYRSKDWIKFMHTNGHRELWVQENRRGLTPVELTPSGSDVTMQILYKRNKERKGPCTKNVTPPTDEGYFKFCDIV